MQIRANTTKTFTKTTICCLWHTKCCVNTLYESSPVEYRKKKMFDTLNMVLALPEKG